MSRRDMAGDDYGPFDDDYRGFDVREDEAARGPLILALAVGVLLIFGGVVWNTYRQGVRPPAEGVPRILAEPQPYKSLPEDPGGKPILHTDKKFYDAIDGSEREPELPLAQSGQPVLAGSQILAGAPPRDLRPTSPGALPAEPVETVPAPQPVEDAPGAHPLPETPQLAAVTARPAEQIQPAPAARARFTFAEDGPFLVQIAALRTEEAAETAWRRVTSSSPELYHGARKRIQRADLGSEGVFYRLRVGAFTERSEAVAFCEAIKEAGANCIVVTG
ncbi:MAG: SPOR domain-containing protein [Hyphomonas sp.]